MTNEELHKLAENWLEEKKQRMANLLKIALPDEALYREIMLSLGYPKNKVPFLELALLLPYSEIKNLKTKELIEKALLYRAGFIDDHTGLPSNFDTSLRMQKSVWTHKGTRPANFPEKRIQGISSLLSETISKGIVNFFLERIETEVSNTNPKIALKRIMDFKGIGIARKEEMFFNIIFPFMLVCSNKSNIHKFLFFLFENYPPLKENRLIIEALKEDNVKPQNVKEYMGLIYIEKQ